MPELPEVERLRLTLLPHLLGATVLKGTLKRRDYCTVVGETGAVQKGPVSEETLLVGGTINALSRKGKQLAMTTADGRVAVIHLGMSGQVLFTVGTRVPRANHQHVEWLLRRGDATDGTMVFRDPRRFGGLWSYPSVELLERTAWSKLGPDGLTSPVSHLEGSLRRVAQGGERPSARSIKMALLDQALIAGVGNIYADESLFLAGIRPDRLCRELTPEDVARLARAVRQVLGDAVAKGGSTLKDYRDANGAGGTAQQTHMVYGRGAEACRICGTRLKWSFQQRTTVFCGVCQR